MPTCPEEQALIDLWRQGDQDAARRIVDRYIDRLLPLARRHLSQRLASRIDPEDIVQSVFRTFFSRLKEGQFVFHDQVLLPQDASMSPPSESKNSAIWSADRVVVPRVRQAIARLPRPLVSALSAVTPPPAYIAT